MVGHLVDPADFRRLLATPMRSRSAHFALHHVKASPSTPSRPVSRRSAPELSTGLEPACHQPVDDFVAGRWLGCVVPKRLARRAVTRTLLKRQMRAALERQQAALPPGLWLVRLRAPFAAGQFPSAASDALRLAARTELDRLLMPLRC
jgi:ribonuclease P protein component